MDGGAISTDVLAATIPVQSDFRTVKSALIILCFPLDKRFPKSYNQFKIGTVELTDPYYKYDMMPTLKDLQQ